MCLRIKHYKKPSTVIIKYRHQFLAALANIFAGWEYAEDLGFSPHKDFTMVTQYFLEEDTDDIELIDIECGRNGKPLYVKGAYDTPLRVKEIMNQLNTIKGEGGYDYIISAEEDNDDDEYSDGFNSYGDLSFEEKGVGV